MPSFMWRSTPWFDVGKSCWILMNIEYSKMAYFNFISLMENGMCYMTFTQLFIKKENRLSYSCKKYTKEKDTMPSILFQQILMISSKYNITIRKWHLLIHQTYLFSLLLTVISTWTLSILSDVLVPISTTTEVIQSRVSIACDPHCCSQRPYLYLPTWMNNDAFIISVSVSLMKIYIIIYSNGMFCDVVK